MTVETSISFLLSLILTASFSALAYFMTSWKTGVTKQFEEVTADLRHLRESVFSVTLQEESRKGKFYAVFARLDDLKDLQEKLYELNLRIVKIEALNTAYSRRHEDIINNVTVTRAPT